MVFVLRSSLFCEAVVCTWKAILPLLTLVCLGTGTEVVLSTLNGAFSSISMTPVLAAQRSSFAQCEALLLLAAALVGAGSGELGLVRVLRFFRADCGAASAGSQCCSCSHGRPGWRCLRLFSTSGRCSGGGGGSWPTLPRLSPDIRHGTGFALPGWWPLHTEQSNGRRSCIGLCYLSHFACQCQGQPPLSAGTRRLSH